MNKIKKLAVLLLSVLMVFGISAMAAGCSDSDKLEELSRRIAALEEENKSLSEELQSIDYTNLQQRITDMNKEIKNLTERLQEIQSEELLQRIENLKNDIKTLSDRLQELEIQNANGTFYTLQQAYDLQLLTQEDLQAIADYHNNFEQYPVKLTDTEVWQIQLSAAKYDRNNEEYPVQDAKAEDYLIYKFYGRYNGCYAIILPSPYVDYPLQVLDIWETIGNVDFHYTYYYRIVIFKLM